MRVFKYLPPTRTDVLSNKAIRFTQPKYLNDPFEQLPFIPRLIDPIFYDLTVSHLQEHFANNDESVSLYLDKILGYLDTISFFDITDKKEYKKKFKELSRILNAIPKHCLYQLDSLAEIKKIVCSPSNDSRMSKQLRELIDRKIGILSLARRHDNLITWSHYADNHRGFVIEFDPEDSMFDNQNALLKRFKKLQSVKYVKTRPEISLLKLNSKLELELDKSSADIFLTKSQGWKYEEELRMIRTLDQCTLHPKAKKFEVFLYSFNPSAVLNIYLGANVNTTCESQIRQILGKEHYRHVGFFKGGLSHCEYKIEFKPYNTA